MIVAKRYTKAFYQTLRSSNGGAETVGSYKAELEQVEAAISGSREGRVALYGPVVSSRDKVTVMKAICEKAKASKSTTQFLMLLARKNRLVILPEVIAAFDEIVAEAEGALMGLAVSADPLSATDVEALADSFSRKLGKSVRLRVKTDPALLAGVKVTVNGVTYDGSLKAQIARLKDSFVQGATKH